MSIYICERQYKGEPRFSKSKGYHHKNGDEKSWVERVMNREDLLKDLYLIPVEHRKSALFWIRRKENSPKKAFYLTMIEEAKKIRMWVDTTTRSMI